MQKADAATVLLARLLLPRELHEPDSFRDDCNFAQLNASKCKRYPLRMSPATFWVWGASSRSVFGWSGERLVRELHPRRSVIAPHVEAAVLAKVLKLTQSR